MNLEIIRTQTTWNDAAGSINSNYAKIADAIAQLKANGGGGGGGADIDLTAYATKVWVEAKGYITASALAPYALKEDIPSLVGYATEDFVNNKLQNYTTTEDLVENYASKSDLESAIDGIDLSPYLKTEDAEDTYATKDYVTTKLVDYAPLTSVQGFENRIGGLEGAVPQLNERVTTVEGKVSTLNETVSTGENNLLDRVNTIETDYVTSGDLESAINDIDLSAYLLKADLTKSRIQSTLGISDWALAATKPSYAWSEITSRPTALSQFTDDVVAGKYLPLSGGTINSTAVQPLYLKNNQSSCGILFFNNTDNATLMYSGGSNWRVTDNGWSNAYYLLHSGNIGNYKAGDSDKLGGKSKDYYIGQNTDVSQVIDLNTIERNHIIHGNKWSHNLSSTIASVLDISYSADWRSQLLFNSNTKRIYSRFFTEGYLWSDWQQIAFITDNVASATKLANKVSLWGNEFNGTGDVSGNLYSDIWRVIKDSTSNGIFIQSANYDGTSDSGNIYMSARNGNKLTSFNVWANNSKFSNNVTIAGNVGIGNESPTEKLDVSGNIKASGNINATSITINGVTITASNGSITVNGNVLATGAITAKAVG